MSIFSDPIPQQEEVSSGCRPTGWSERIPLLLRYLLGRTPLRRLSQSLIIILMLISPLSFSTDKISNFTYECPVSRNCSIKERRTAAIISSNLQHPQTVILPPANSYPLPAPRHPQVLQHTASTHSRAPPA